MQFKTLNHSLLSTLQPTANSQHLCEATALRLPLLQLLLLPPPLLRSSFHFSLEVRSSAAGANSQGSSGTHGWPLRPFGTVDAWSAGRGRQLSGAVLPAGLQPPVTEEPSVSKRPARPWRVRMTRCPPTLVKQPIKPCSDHFK